MIGAEVVHGGTEGAEAGAPARLGSAVVRLAGRLLRPGYRHSAAGGNRRGGAVGSRRRYIPTAQVDISMAGRIVHSGGIAVRAHRRLSHWKLRDIQTGRFR